MTLRKAGIEYRGWEVEEARLGSPFPAAAPAVATDGNFTVLFSSRVPFAKQRFLPILQFTRPIALRSSYSILDAPETRNAHSSIADAMDV